jgi:hypothetical protein
VLNRGITPDELPPDVERLHAAREDSGGMQRVLQGKSWDVLVDTTSYTGNDAQSVHSLFRGRCERAIFISTGQVYLVRAGIRPPFRESDYDGALIPAPASSTADHKDWLYGVHKRDAEDAFEKGANDFAVASLRLPMIASERDHYARIQGYIARVRDGGPILVPDGASLPIRHVYVHDVTRLIEHLAANPWKGYRAFNISCGESISLPDFFRLLGGELGAEVPVRYVSRTLLEDRRLLPACSPYSGKWMSELDNSLSLSAFSASGLRYARPAEYLPGIISDYSDRWAGNEAAIPGYDRRGEELEIAEYDG